MPFTDRRGAHALWHLGEAARKSALSTPFLASHRGQGNLTLGPALQVQCLGRTDSSAQATAYTSPSIHQADLFHHG